MSYKVGDRILSTFFNERVTPGTISTVTEGSIYPYRVNAGGATDVLHHDGEILPDTALARLLLGVRL